MTDHFNEKAKTWDADDMIKMLSSAVGAAILQHTRLEAQMEVMDFGAGTGLISSHVAPKVNKITAVDISTAMLDRLVAKPELHARVEAVCQDILEQPLSQQFDLIMSAMAMHHVKDTIKLIQTFYAHLKPGASIALADLDKEDGSFHPADVDGVYHAGFEREPLQSILEAHGFENVVFHTAHTVHKEGKDYPIFLVVATKSAEIN
ncbi:MAG: methyltransferase domain-containing protein [Gammaproteobacteria bacterium]|nr:methyltransferase domain-containing protein [Gammaproteobacteria bacterium]MCW8922565.1 methyltransferase domain-containing protein [Gammaproteobacteria bacterium]